MPSLPKPVHDRLAQEFKLAASKVAEADGIKAKVYFFSVFYGEYDGPNNQDQDLTAASIGMMRVFYRDERISPYLLFAGGYHETARDSGTDDSNIMGEVAFGLLTSVGEPGQSSVAVRAEVRWRADFQDDEQFNEFIANIGVQIPFGKAKE